MTCMCVCMYACICMNGLFDFSFQNSPRMLRIVLCCVLHFCCVGTSFSHSNLDTLYTAFRFPRQRQNPSSLPGGGRFLVLVLLRSFGGHS